MSKAPPRNDVLEHEQIMRAALAKNVNRAVTLNCEHIERTLNKVAKSLENHPEFSKPARPSVPARETRMSLAG
jgi:DNA-binding GntR family transcriptional regulator